MRLTIALGISFGVTATAFDYSAYNWLWMPDLTADELTAERMTPLELIPELTTVEENKSYIVRLECVGCPFRNRHIVPAHIGQTTEAWETDRDNSLLLNITVDDSTPSQPHILLNGHRIEMLEGRPPAITAVQTPDNTTSDRILLRMMNEHLFPLKGFMNTGSECELRHSMNDSLAWEKSLIPGSKYGIFALEYEHTRLMTTQQDEEWIQFDVKGIHHAMGSFPLNQDGQKLVQLLVSTEATKVWRKMKPQPETPEEKEDSVGQRVVIKDIQVVERNQQERPIYMPCGKPAMIWYEYNPLEYDRYGWKGSLTWVWHRFSWGILDFLNQAGLVPIGIAVIGVVAYVVGWRRRRERMTVSFAEDDAESALLTSEIEDAPPRYEDVPHLEMQKEEE